MATELGVDTRVTRRVRAAVIECNEDQLHSMMEELQIYFGLDVIEVPLDALTSGSASRELREVDILIFAGHDQVIARAATAHGKPCIITRVRPALLERLSRLLGRGAVYLLVSDPRFGTKLRRLVAPMAHSENLHVLLADRDDLSVIPRGAPTYVTRSTLHKFSNRRHAGREIMPQRIFSRDTGHEILARILTISADSQERR